MFSEQSNYSHFFVFISTFKKCSKFFPHKNKQNKDKETKRKRKKVHKKTDKCILFISEQAVSSIPRSLCPVPQVL